MLAFCVDEKNSIMQIQAVQFSDQIQKLFNFADSVSSEGVDPAIHEWELQCFVPLPAN